MRLLTSATLLFSVLVSRIVADIQIYNLTTTSTNLSSLCVGVLNQVQSCDKSITWAGYSNRYESDDVLSTLCTSACASSLANWLRRAAGACTQRYVDPVGNAVLPAYYVETVVENYNLLCLKNGDKFCNAVIRNAVGIDPENQSQTKSASPSVTCDDCFIKQIQTKLQMPLRSESDLAKTFTALTSSCKKTGFAVTPVATSTAWIVPAGSITSPVSGATPTPSGTCDGTTYTVRSSDTCQSIAAARGISVSGLLTANNLPAFCAKFPTSGTLCIPTAERCRVYTVKSGDTCVSIADANKLTWAQLVSWNLVLGVDCSNIVANVGYPICISTPGGNWVNPSGGGNDTPSSTQDTSTIVITGTDADQLPVATDMPIANDTWLYKFAPLTRLDCVNYANSSTFGTSASCATVAKGFGVQESDLVAWNPSLQASCTLDGSQTYCVQQSIKNASDTITPYCNLQDTALYNMRCDQFLAAWAIDAHRLDDLNPGVGKACENWKYGHNYCVSAPYFKPAGYASNCNKFAVADNTDQLADPCAVMETQYGLSHARFVAWNPSVFQNCTGMIYGYDYCVSIPNYKPTYTSYVNTLVTMTPNGPNAMGIEQAVATGSASSESDSSGSKTTAASTAAASASITGTLKPRMHKHKRVHKHGGGL